MSSKQEWLLVYEDGSTCPSAMQSYKNIVNPYQ